MVTSELAKLEGWDLIRAKTARLRRERKREKEAKRYRGARRGLTTKWERQLGISNEDLFAMTRVRCDECSAIAPRFAKIGEQCRFCRNGKYFKRGKNGD